MCVPQNTSVEVVWQDVGRVWRDGESIPSTTCITHITIIQKICFYAKCTASYIHTCSDSKDNVYLLCCSKSWVRTCSPSVRYYNFPLSHVTEMPSNQMTWKMLLPCVLPGKIAYTSVKQSLASQTPCTLTECQQCLLRKRCLLWWCDWSAMWVQLMTHKKRGK